MEEEEDWGSKDDVEDGDTTSNSVIAETSLDRMACSLGGKIVLPHIQSNVPQMLAHASWEYRQAGLNVLSATAEGCRKQMQPILEQVSAQPMDSRSKRSSCRRMVLRKFRIL